MTKIKPITEISTEDLLKSIEDNKDIKEEKLALYRNDIIDFISHFNLKQGEEKISTRLLYTIYKSWSKVKITKQSFVTNLGSFFSLSRGTGGRELMVSLNLDHNMLLRKSIRV